MKMASVKRLLRGATFVLCLAGMSALPAYTKGPEEGDPTPPEISCTVQSAPARLTAPGKGKLLLSLRIPKGYHLFGGEALSVTAQLPPWAKAGTPVYPKGKMEEEIEVLRGAVTIELPVELGDTPGKRLEGTFHVDWQGCQDFGEKVCFLPTTDRVPFALEVAPASISAPTSIPAAAAPGPSPATGVPPSPAPDASTPSATSVPEEGFRELGRFSGFKNEEAFLLWLSEAQGENSASEPQGMEAKFAAAAKGNLPLALVLAFLFGLLSSLTPCVYPVIPITVAYIGSRSEGKPRSYGFLLSLAFVGGLAIVYATLGAVSAGFGFAFGSLTQNIWVGLGVALLFFALALSMFNLFELKTPSGLTNRLEKSKQAGRGKGFFGAFLIGAISGLVASPCIGPLVLAILVVVASTGSVFLGFLYLFVYALGLGVLFVVIGTFSGILSSLPKSGGWMDGVRILFGSLILAASFYFAGLYLSRNLFLVVALVALWGVILFLLFGAKRHFFTVPLRVAGILLSAGALVLALWVLPSATSEKDQMRWVPSLEEGAITARGAQKPILLDFRADWCVACVELEEKTWPKAKVQEKFAGLVPVRMDMTKNTEENRALQQRFGVKGLPTVILLAPPEGATP